MGRWSGSGAHVNTWERLGRGGSAKAVGEIKVATMTFISLPSAHVGRRRESAWWWC